MHHWKFKARQQAIQEIEFTYQLVAPANNEERAFSYYEKLISTTLLSPSTKEFERQAVSRLSALLPADTITIEGEN